MENFLGCLTKMDRVQKERGRGKVLTYKDTDGPGLDWGKM